MAVSLLRRRMLAGRWRGFLARSIVSAAIIVRARQHEIVWAGNTSAPQHSRRYQDNQKRTERRPYHAGSQLTARSRGCQTRVTLKADHSEVLCHASLVSRLNIAPSAAGCC